MKYARSKHFEVLKFVPAAVEYSSVPFDNATS